MKGLICCDSNKSIDLDVYNEVCRSNYQLLFKMLQGRLCLRFALFVILFALSAAHIVKEIANEEK